jgi:4-hydroxy-tetrahydrodipicolinate reductase
MDKIRVCVAGATGWVGKSLIPITHNASDMSLVGAVSRTSSGKDIGTLLNVRGLSVWIKSNVKDALDTPADVLVDFTSPDSVKSNVLTAIRRGVSAVVGPSGLSDEDYDEIDREAAKEEVGVIAAGNFAISAALLLHFSVLAAKHMPSWEIVDFASSKKVDAPSGMTRELAYRLSKVRLSESEIPVSEVKGIKEARGANINGTQIHSIRLPGTVIGAEVLFGRPDERLSIRYDAGTSAQLYIEGTLLAIRKVQSFKGLKRGLGSIPDL